jgi:hypothetical protein
MDQAIGTLNMGYESSEQAATIVSERIDKVESSLGMCSS